MINLLSVNDRMR